MRPVLGPQLRTVRYPVAGRPKQVEYWSAFSPGSPAAASHEMNAVSWLPLPLARQRLSYPHDGDVIAGLTPRPTVPLIVVRHATAGQKADWHGDDLLRPLDAGGEQEAGLLADLLCCFAPAARVISSPALRCTQTMRPYAARFGGSVEAEAVWRRPAAAPILPWAERARLMRSRTCSAAWWRTPSPRWSACTGRTCPGRWRRPAPRSGRPAPRSHRTRRCPRAVSGLCTPRRGRWPHWSATSSEPSRSSGPARRSGSPRRPGSRCCPGRLRGPGPSRHPGSQ